MTLDKLLPADMRDSVVQVPVNIPQGVKDICAELQNEEGIASVFLGRQVEERRVVSQASCNTSIHADQNKVNARTSWLCTYSLPDSKDIEWLECCTVKCVAVLPFAALHILRKYLTLLCQSYSALRFDLSISASEH